MMPCYPGGHGPLWDLAEDPRSVKLIQNMLAAGKPVAAVCHAPGVLRHARTADGKPMVQGRQVTGFSNAEEAAVGLSQIVPFLVEDELVRLGAQYSRAEDWQPHVIADGLLITGQNPASSVGWPRPCWSACASEPTGVGDAPPSARGTCSNVSESLLYDSDAAPSQCRACLVRCLQTYPQCRRHRQTAWLPHPRPRMSRSVFDGRGAAGLVRRRCSPRCARAIRPRVGTATAWWR